MQNSIGRTILYLIVISIIIVAFYFLKSGLELEAYPDGHRVEVIEDPAGEEGVKTKSFTEEKSEARLEIDTVSREGYSDKVEHKEDTVLADINEPKEKIIAQPAKSSDFNDKITGFFEDLVKNYQEEVLSSLPPDKSRSDVIIRYYEHQTDGPAVGELKKYGFYIHKRPVEEEFSGYRSNSIYYGDDVPLRDIRLIAYVLIENDFPLKQIIPSKFHDSWKSRSVEIGAEPAVESNPPFTREDIMRFQKEY